MRCFDEGLLRAYLDGEVGGDERETFLAHLAACPACARQLDQVESNAKTTATLLGRWLPEPIAESTSAAIPEERRASLALARFQVAVREDVRGVETAPRGPFVVLKEQMIQMFARLTAPRLRPTLAAVSLVAILAMVLAFSPLSSLADQLSKTFRVQQFAAVTVRVPGMTSLPQPQQITPEQQQMGMQMLAALGTPTTNATKDTVAEVADTAAAKSFLAQYGATLQVPGKLPAAYSGTTARYGTAQPTSSSYLLNVATAQQYLALANSPELNSLPWPTGVTQMTFGLDTPAAVATYYGDGQTNGLGIVQMANLAGAGPGAGPALKLPDELDVNAFRAALLALPGLPQDTVAQLQNVKDWDRTLIIPVPEDATTKNVTIKGNAGLLILDGQGRGSLLIWQDNGIMYAVGGTVSEAEVLDVANGLTTAP
ncbi:MAG TPA: zf-HC2 domain-containing protein [Thermomicrobiales bacterium]